ncbi:MAG TPA: nicotinamide riboside transporter PnuC [Chitinophagaceae bacterium]|nr:nicotinamide riboside transporter PnuC [Chitinophagaceae bacterium]
MTLLISGTELMRQIAETSRLEWLAFFSAVLQVWLALKNRRINFLFGIFSVACYIEVFRLSGLYAESLLNGYYLIMSIAGYFSWHQKNKLIISVMKPMEHFKMASLTLLLSFLLFFYLRTFTSSTVPVWDAFISALAWIGTWLMVRRKLENWLYLNISNTLAIPLLWYKGLELTALLTLIYWILAIRGWFAWKKQFHQPSGNENLSVPVN